MYNCCPKKTWFWGSDCLVLLVVLVARAGPAEFRNCHPIYNCEVDIRLPRMCTFTCIYVYILCRKKSAECIDIGDQHEVITP